ncbi:MAG: beta-phosphoglucomutase [Flavipsychrobacter sp.]|jgi:beta-phosphoglucomutase|nr:beta-phosphoglucomutase [Flavipsychrobacter sp.]
MTEAVIFDFDGVLGDTMHDNCVAWQKSFERYGYALQAVDYYKLEGMGRYQIAENILRQNDLDLGLTEDIVTFKEEYYRQNNTFRLYDGVDDIFRFLKEKNVPVAIVTGASKARISQHLDKAIEEALTVLITADDVTHTKPHPEPYLKAVGKLNKPAGSCIVVENAILGIQSAKAAGCACYALETTLSKADLAMADEVFATHKELLSKFEAIF